jgi:hypothetical protein
MARAISNRQIAPHQDLADIPEGARRVPRNGEGPQAHQTLQMLEVRTDTMRATQTGALWCLASTRMPTRWGMFTTIGFERDTSTATDTTCRPRASQLKLRQTQG